MNTKFNFKQLVSIAKKGGGTKRIASQHKKGKKTARERLELLLDPGTFVETDMFVLPRNRPSLNGNQSSSYTDGVITGWGKINDRLVYVYAQDFTIIGGSLGEAHGLKIARLQEMAHKSGAPVIGLYDSGGARIQEGVDSLAACGEVFTRNVRSSGIIPQIALIIGPCAGAAVYSPALMDFVFMEEQNSYMFLTGPEVVKAVTHEEVDFQTLGGAEVHANQSGVVNFINQDEEEMMSQVRWLLSFLPSNNLDQPPYSPPEDKPNRKTKELNDIVPTDEKKPYDVTDVIEVIVDDGIFLEVHKDFAKNIVVGFARMDGHTVGIIANQQ